MAKTTLIREYMNESLGVLKRMNPSVPESALKKILKESIKANFSNVAVNIVNNYENTSQPTTLMEVIELITSDKYEGTPLHKPIITGYGTLYSNQNFGEAELTGAIKNLLDMRKVYKNKMFNHINDEDKSMYKFYDLIQKIYKVLANSIYGVLGQQAAIFYNGFSAPSITYTGVMAVTTAVNVFEAFLGNNFKFKNVDDIIKYIDNIVKESYEYDFESIITYEEELVTKERLIEYLYSKLTNKDEFSYDLLELAVDDLDQFEMTKIFFKNNLREFFKLESIKENFLDYMTGNAMYITEINEDGKEKSHIDGDYKDVLDNFYDVLREWVVYYHVPFDRYEFAMTSKRNSSIVTDTDSTFLNLNYFVNWIGDEFNHNIDVNTIDGNLQVINNMIFILSKFISDFMMLLTKNANVPEKYRPLLNMKSEYLYSRLTLTKNKKQYAGILVAQEGNLLNKPELDIKGMSIKKSNVSLPARKFFTEILEEKILKDKNINLANILSDFKSFEASIINQIKVERNPTILIPAKCNTVESYADPYKMSPLRGVIAWNLVYENEQIRPPENVYRIPLISNKNINSIEYLYNEHPEIFEIIKENFYDHKEMSNYGFNTFAIPKDAKEIPEWIIPLIDIEKIVSMTLSSGEVLLNSLGLAPVKSSQPGNSSDKRLFLSNIIEF